MPENLFQISVVFLFSLLAALSAASQTPVCRPAALKAVRPIPQLHYDCREDLTDSDDAVLVQPNRREALDHYAQALEKLTFSDWWQFSVEDLNVCDYRKKPGALTKEEKLGYVGGEYFFSLRGNDRYRVVVARDPCYQVGFGGANVFLLNRAGAKVYASQIIDGFYTRAEAPLGFDFAAHGTETVIEIATSSGGLSPSETFYYFTIDPKTNRAVPKNLFRTGGRMTNQIHSQMILGEPAEYGLPRRAQALQIIKNHRLARYFYIFEDTGERFGDNPKFRRILLRWNGKFYE